MSFGTDSLKKSDLAKSSVKNFHRPKFLEILEKIKNASKEGKEEIRIDDNIEGPVLAMLKNEHFVLSTTTKGWIISWVI